MRKSQWQNPVRAMAGTSFMLAIGIVAPCRSQYPESRATKGSVRVVSSVDTVKVGLALRIWNEQAAHNAVLATHDKEASRLAPLALLFLSIRIVDMNQEERREFFSEAGHQRSLSEAVGKVLRSIVSGLDDQDRKALAGSAATKAGKSYVEASLRILADMPQERRRALVLRYENEPQAGGGTVSGPVYRAIIEIEYERPLDKMVREQAAKKKAG